MRTGFVPAAHERDAPQDQRRALRCAYQELERCIALLSLLKIDSLDRLSVPTEIRIHFDTARHLLVHSWYVYRFIQVAEAHALGAVEMALRKRLGVGDRSRSSLKPLSRRAGVLADSGFRHLWRRGDPPDPGRAGISDAALRLEAEGRDRSNEYVKILLDALPGYKSELAHGSAMLAPGGRVVLSICRDAVDQLFAAPATRTSSA